MTETRWTEPDFCKRYGSGHDLPQGHLGEHAFYRVKARAKLAVWVYTGNSRPSNAWYGTANIRSQELEKVALEPGDEIHNLYGALYLVKKDASEGRRMWTDANEHQAFSQSVKRLDLQEWEYRAKREVSYK